MQHHTLPARLPVGRPAGRPPWQLPMLPPVLLALAGLLIGPGAWATDITSCPFKITAPGDYHVTQDLSCSSTTKPAIEIDANYVFLSLDGHTITGPGKTQFQAIGILVNGVPNDSQGISNGTISGFGTAVDLTANGCSVDLLTVTNCDNGVGIEFGASYNAVVKNSFSGCDVGIMVGGPGNEILNNTANGNKTGISISDPTATGNSVEGNTALNNASVDLEDTTTHCSNRWTNNCFGTESQSCIGTSSCSPVSITCPLDKTVRATASSPASAFVDVGAPTTVPAGAPVLAQRQDGLAVTDPFPLGVTHITWMTTGFATCMQTVTVLAPIAANITCPGNRTVTAPPGQNSATVGISMATSTDTGATIVGVRSDGKALTDPFPVGYTIITWTASAVDATPETCTQTISVLAAGSTALSLQCPDNITVRQGGSQSGAHVSYAEPIAQNNSGAVTFACVPPSGALFAVGTTTVSCAGIDSLGHSASCSFTVTVEAAIPVQIQCPASRTVTAPSSQSSSLVAAGMATSTTEGATIVGVRSDGKALTDPYPVGTTTITWVATADEQPPSTCTQTIVVLPAYTRPFIVVGPASADPHVESIFPDRGPLYQRAIIHGHGFADVQGTSYVLLGNHQVPVLAWTAVAIDIVVNPLGYHQSPLALNAAYPVQVVTPAAGKRSNTVDFFLTDGPPADYPNPADAGPSDQPSFAGFQRNLFCPGDTVALMGAGFGSAQGTGYVSVSVPLMDPSGHVVQQVFAEPVLAWSENVVNFVLLLPAGAIPGTYTATVHRGNGKSVSGSFTVGTRVNGACMAHSMD